MKDPIITEFATYRSGLTDDEIEDFRQKLSQIPKRTHRFRALSDILIEYVESGEWVGHSNALVAMCARGCFLRGLYEHNQTLGRRSQNIIAKAYASAARCRQSFDSRWMNTLRQYTNQIWQSGKYVEFAEISGLFAYMLTEFGYTAQATEIANDTISRVTEATKDDNELKITAQIALLDAKIALADLAVRSGARDEALIRLDAAESAARPVEHEIALSDIEYSRAGVLLHDHEYAKLKNSMLLNIARCEQMGYLDGVSKCRNRLGIAYLYNRQLHEAREQFEEYMVLQQQLGSNIGLVRALINIGEVDKHLGNLELAESYNKRALELCQEMENVRGIVTCTLNLGDIAVLTGRFDDAFSYYDSGLDAARRANLSESVILAHLQMADAHLLRGESQVVADLYSQTEKEARQLSDPMNTFAGAVGKLVVALAAGESPPSDVLQWIASIMGSLAEWTEISASQSMQNVRSKILKDPHVTSDLCVFYDINRIFQCMVDQTTLSKDCCGNLLWKGTLCPYFKEFMSRLSRHIPQEST